MVRTREGQAGTVPIYTIFGRRTYGRSTDFGIFSSGGRVILLSANGLMENRIALIGYPARDTKRYPDGRVEESLGGIMFGALALAALGREIGVRAIPVTTLGNDVAEKARELLARAGCRMDAVRVVDAATQHSEITFTDANERTETVSGALSPLGARDIASEADAPWLTARAIGVNFITGNEMSIDTFRLLRERYTGPIVVDYHTLALGTDSGGRRFAHRRADWAAWIGLADVVQMNRSEAETLAGYRLTRPEDAAAFARDLLHLGPRATVITLADEGAVGAERTESGFRTFSVAATSSDGPVDTVGCGDVFHAALTLGWTHFAQLQPAMSLANVAAGLHTGYAGLEGIDTLNRAWRMIASQIATAEVPGNR